MGHLRSGGWGSVIIFDCTVIELGGHGNNHMVKVGVEVTTLWDIKTKWWGIMVTCQQVVWVVDKTGLMGTSLGQLWWPNTLVSILGLMDSHVWWPDSVMDLALSEVPLLEVIRSILLMGRVDLGQEFHLLSEFDLIKTFLNEEIVLLMHSSVATLAGS